MLTRSLILAQARASRLNGAANNNGISAAVQSSREEGAAGTASRVGGSSLASEQPEYVELKTKFDTEKIFFQKHLYYLYNILPTEDNRKCREFI